jgi:hypothetical protein
MALAEVLASERFPIRNPLFLIGTLTAYPCGVHNGDEDNGYRVVKRSGEA